LRTLKPEILPSGSKAMRTTNGTGALLYRQ
jgi:hypothetical protein